MIRHLVLLRFRPDVTETGRAALMAELDALRARLPGMLSFARLSNISTEIPVVHGFQDGFAIDLADEAARDAYLIDPEHRAIGARLVAACAGGAEGLIVFDHAL